MGPMVGEPVMVAWETQQCGRQTQRYKHVVDKPCTPLCSLGNTMLALDISLIFVVNAPFLPSQVFYVLVNGGVVCSLMAVFFAFVESPLPRGCGCVPDCAYAQSGCCTCPGVPWYNALGGLVFLIAGFLQFIWFDGHDLFTVIATIVYPFAHTIAGIVWLIRFSNEHGFVCFLSKH